MAAWQAAASTVPRAAGMAAWQAWQAGSTHYGHPYALWPPLRTMATPTHYGHPYALGLRQKAYALWRRGKPLRHVAQAAFIHS